MGKKSTPLYLLWRKLIWVESHRIEQLLTIQVEICIAYPSKGHLRSPGVTNRHLPITFDPKELETWDWCQYVRLGQANRLILTLSHKGQTLNLTFQHVILYMVRRALTRLTRWYKNRCSTFKSKYLIVENPFWKFLNFDPWWPQFLNWAKKWQMISKWFFASFRTPSFVFLYDAQEPRSWECVEMPPPPPPAGGGKSRGPAGRGLTLASGGGWCNPPPMSFSNLDATPFGVSCWNFP